MAGDTPGRECPHDDVEMRPQGTVRMSDDRVHPMNIELPVWGRGVVTPWCYREPSSGELSSCACTTF